MLRGVERAGSGAGRSRRRLTGWGRTSPSVANVVRSAGDDELAEAVASAGPRGVVARGLGRSYGDAAQNGGGTVLDLRGRDRILEVHDSAGATGAPTVRLEAGVSLDALMRALLPRGLFVPVSPGTRQVTVGGAIASDIHGKNHHLDGSFGNHVTSLDLLCGDGELRTLTPRDELFWATVGGMGLTGVVLRATIQMVRVETSSCLVDTQRCPDLDSVMSAMADDDNYPFSVAWIDCLARGRKLGRSVLTRGRFAQVADLPEDAQDAASRFDPRELVRAPAFVPNGLLNRATVTAFNETWYRKAPGRREGELQGIAQFFHPLDGVADWNRIYGANGFLQYQVLVPEGAEETIRRCLEAFSSSGSASFLGVLKRLGPGNPGHLSFPAPGWTLTADIPCGRKSLGSLLDTLDGLVLQAGGREYLAKDSRMAPSVAHQMYPRIPAWQSIRRRTDPRGVFTSDLARRLHL
jgi:decaprenylphospho-beta-D-ribofuranose 2-oxidase